MTKTHTLPTGTMAAQLAPIANPSTHAYFDPSDLMMDYLAHAPELYAKTMASMAWSVDNACLNAARNILFAYYAAAQERAEVASDVVFSEYCAEVHEDLAHESLYAPSENETETPEYTLAVLLAVRNQWHDAAYSAAAANNADYNPKSLRELLESERAREPDVGTLANHAVTARLEANGDKALEARLLESLTAADRLASASRVARNRPLHPTILEILRTVKAYAPETARFDQLPARTQRTLTTQALNTLDRSANDLASRMARQPIAFARMAEAKYQCKQALEKVILSKFADTSELENITSQAQHDMNRAAKRRAMCSID